MCTTIRDRVRSVGQAALAGAESVGAAAKTQLRDLRDDAQDAVDSAERCIRANPVKASVTAAGVGLVLGLALSQLFSRKN